MVLGKGRLHCHPTEMKTTIPRRSQFSVIRQICDLLPQHLVSKLARKTGVDKKAQTISPWSHLVSLIYAQLTHAIGLYDICEGLRLHSGIGAGSLKLTEFNKQGYEVCQYA